MASIVLGIMGKKRSGKDTFAARLVSEHGYTRLAFADALKESLLELDPSVRVEADELVRFYGPIVRVGPDYQRLASIVGGVGWQSAKRLREVRSLLQRHGVAMRNHVGENVWVGAVERKIEEVAGPVVVTDVRFWNEADMVEDTFCGTLIRIERPGLASTDTHISETDLDDREPEYVIPNGSTIENLHATADSLAATLSPFGEW